MQVEPNEAVAAMAKAAFKEILVLSEKRWLWNGLEESNDIGV